MRSLFLFLFIFFIYSPLFAINTNVDNAIVIDWNTNEILFEKNADIHTPPASMTKIMTVYAVFDRLSNTGLSLTDKCTVSKKAFKIGGSSMFLEIDEKVSLNDLLRGIIIQSGNDSSITIAECLSGTEEDFAILMNHYAEKIGMKNTNFSNSSGWPDENNYSTVRDIALLSNAIIRDFPDLYNYFNEKEFTYNNIKQPNRNSLLRYVPGSDGLKTGYTKQSGWGIAGSAIRDNRRITLVINGANSNRQRINESEKLINWAFRETTQKKILSKNQKIKEVDVWLGSKQTINLLSQNDLVISIAFDQLKTLKSYIEYEKPISAPIKKGEILGKLSIIINGKPNIEAPLIADKNVHNINPLFKVFAAIKYLIFGTSLNE